METLFRLREHGTSVRTELLAGLTTFLTMAYILVVNPQILSAAGMDVGAVFTATALSAAIATLVMAFAANLPFALARVWDSTRSLPIPWSSAWDIPGSSPWPRCSWKASSSSP